MGVYILIYIIYIWKRDLVTFDTGWCRWIYYWASWGTYRVCSGVQGSHGLHSSVVPVLCSKDHHWCATSSTHNSEPAIFYYRQSAWIYRSCLANDYNSESITLAKGNPEHLEEMIGFIWFCAWQSVQQQSYVVMFSLKILNLLTLLLFWKFFVLYLWEGKIMV